MSEVQAQSFQESLCESGECGRLIASGPWFDTALGPLDSWPQSLRTATLLLLRSPVPIVMLWGEDGVMLYNDAYSVFAGGRHPRLLGSKVREGWPEVADFNDRVMKVGLAGRTLQFKNQELTLYRNGRPEQVFMDLDYSPVLDESGRPAGVLAIVIETTERVVAERRQSFRLALEERLRAQPDPRGAMDGAVELLGRHLKANRVGYGEVMEDDETIWFRSCYADGVRPLLGEAKLNSYGTESIARQRRDAVEICDDVQADPRQEQETWTAIDTRAFLSVPLIRGGRFTASLYVNFREPRRWLPDEVELIQEVAARTWDAVERARAEEALRASEAGLRRRSEQLQDLAQVASIVARAPTLEEKLNEVTRAARRVVGAHQGAVSLNAGNRWDKTTTYVDLSDKYAPWRTYEAPLDGSGIYAFVCETNQPLRLTQPELEANPRWRGFGSQSGRHPPMRGWLAAPLIGLDGRNLGLIQLSDREDGREFDKNDEAILVQLAQIASAAIEQSFVETSLRASEGRLRLAQKAAGIGVWDWNLDTGSIEWSPEMFAVLGVDPQTQPDELFQAWLAALHPEDQESAQNAALASAKTGAPLSVDFRILGGEDGQKWVRSQGVAVRDSDGRPARLTGINIDVTEERRQQERLRERAQTLEAEVEQRTRERDRILDLSNDLFAAAGVDGYFKVINPAWQRLLGFSEAELMARPFIDGVHPDDRARSAEVVASLARGEPLVHFENRLLTKDGRARWIAWTGVPEGDRIYGYGRDITADKQREAELEAAQEALRQSQKMEAMGQLTGGVAHDFNNLLAPIVGSLDMLQRRGVGAEREQRLIAGAAQAAERAKTLVQRLLAFARRQPLQPVAVDLGKLVVGMGDLVSSTTGPQIKVTVEAADDLPPAKADPNQLEMALLNLSVNARDAMPDGGTIRISVGAESVAPGHRSKLKPDVYLCLSVADTGSGMDEATLARAVEPFFSTKGVGKGTGLGLSMVHGLAVQLGGALTIQSRIGLGTNVELWLPRSVEAVEPADSGAEIYESEGLRGTALLVDDEALVRMSTADMLHDLGYRVVEAASGEEALRLLNKGERFDLLVTDHLMPGLTGIDLARAARDARPGQAVLLISGYAESEGVAADLPRLTKPFRKDELAASLAQLTWGRRA